MFKALPLLVPALIPSWRFFDTITASPRIEVEHAAGGEWRAFRPRPRTLPLAARLRRLFWDPERNEALFMVGCAERLLDTGAAVEADEIFARITAAPGPPARRFRIVLVGRDAQGSTREVAHVSAPRPGA